MSVVETVHVVIRDMPGEDGYWIVGVAATREAADRLVDEDNGGEDADVYEISEQAIVH